MSKNSLHLLSSTNPNQIYFRFPIYYCRATKQDSLAVISLIHDELPLHHLLKGQPLTTTIKIVEGDFGLILRYLGCSKNR